MFRSRIRRQPAVAPGAELTATYEELPEIELAADSDEGASLPAESDGVIPMILRFDGRELPLFSTITTFGTHVDITLDEVAIESYYPADAESAAYFEESNDDASREPDSGCPGRRMHPRHAAVPAYMVEEARF